MSPARHRFGSPGVCGRSGGVAQGASSGGSTSLTESIDSRFSAAVKSQRADLERILRMHPTDSLGCGAGARGGLCVSDSVGCFRNIQGPCELTQRVSEPYKQKHHQSALEVFMPAKSSILSGLLFVVCAKAANYDCY